MKKSIIIIGIVIIIISLVVFYNYFYWPIAPRPSLSKLEKELKENEATLSSIIEYLNNYEYDRLTIRYRNGEIKVYSTQQQEGGRGSIGDVTFDNEEILNNMIHLFEVYKHVKIEKADNYVYFHRWSDQRRGIGLVYTFDGNAPKSGYLNFTETKKISAENWYYCIEE